MDHTRHSAIYDISARTCTIIGAGGIGAITAITLAKMGISTIRIFDDDRVDDVNLATQFHSISDLGRLKVEAVARNVELFSDETSVYPYPKRVTPITDLTDWLVISAVDSIDARKDIWQAVRASRVGWYLDARMASEVFQLYAVDMATGDVSNYEEVIRSVNESDVPEEPCTSKATFFCACTGAGHIGATVRKIATFYQVPFLQVHDIFNTNLTVI